MAATQYTINGVTMKRSSGFRIERYRITKSSRLANGSMSMELVANKRKFILTYEAIKASDMNTILDVIWESSSVFYTFTYIESNVSKSATVYAGDIPSTLHRTDDVDWVWKDVEIHFIEQ